MGRVRSRFDAKLAGLEPGANKTFTVHFPADYPSAELAGSDMTYTVTVHGIKKRVLPALDDEFAKDLGEFETRLFLFQQLNDQNEAVRGATGWDGDRYAVVNTPQGQGIVWLTVWDAPVEAGEFFHLAGQAVEARYSTKAAKSSTDLVKNYSAAGRTLQVSTMEIQGRPVVIYVDVPAGANTSIINPAQVTLAEEH